MNKSFKRTAGILRRVALLKKVSMIVCGLAAVCIIVSSISSAWAYKKLPTEAVPVPAAELRKAYSGKMMKWKDGAMYWNANGKVIGVTPNGHSLADGTWTAVNGKVCYKAVWLGINPADKPHPLHNCFGCMRDGKKVYHQFTSDRGADLLHRRHLE